MAVGDTEHGGRDDDGRLGVGEEELEAGGGWGWGTAAVVVVMVEERHFGV